MEASPMTIKERRGDNDWTLLATARVNDGTVLMQWVDKTWADWRELHDDEAYKKLATIARDKLAKSTGGMAKGIGKGKGGKKGKW